MARCLQCRKPIAGRPENLFAPFCSERCKMVDLGKWLGEEYRVPAQPPQEGDEQELGVPPPPNDDDPLLH